MSISRLQQNFFSYSKDTMPWRQAKLAASPEIKSIFTLVSENEEWISGYHVPENDLLSHEIRKIGVWEPVQTELFLEILAKLKSSDEVVDVGAHIGYYTIIAASKGFNVHAFEPQNIYHKTLQTNVQGNNLGKKVSAVKSYVSNYNQNKDNSVTVTLDHYFEHPSKIGLLKINVLGHEPEVIAGAKNLLAHKDIDAIIIHVYPNFREDKEAYIGMIKTLSEHKYLGYVIEESASRKLEPATNHLRKLLASRPLLHTKAEELLNKKDQATLVFVSNSFFASLKA